MLFELTFFALVLLRIGDGLLLKLMAIRAGSYAFGGGRLVLSRQL